MYKACIFDLDGTLTDTLDSLIYSVNETMKEIGLPTITADQCRRYVGNGARVLIEKTLRASGDESLSRFDEAYAAYQRIFDKNCMYHVKPCRGIPELLGFLKSRGIRLGVLSNKPDRQAVHVVEDVFGKNVFDHIQGQIDGVPRKPDPTALFSMSERFGAAPSETLYVGDSEVDVATGKAAGMDTILVLWGFRSREELQEAGASIIVESAEEISNIVREQEEKNG